MQITSKRGFISGVFGDTIVPSYLMTDGMIKILNFIEGRIQETPPTSQYIQIHSLNDTCDTPDRIFEALKFYRNANWNIGQFTLGDDQLKLQTY